ncbi:MAG: hypothetical protein EPN17_04285 [Methylobacter sp.]|nr:MAG: hypothetical protein EPN17_04285 [Methylobacter sp.]
MANIAVFDNNEFVDSNNDHLSSESDNIQATLISLGHNVSTFIQYSAIDFSSALESTDILVIPEQETGNLSLALTDKAKQVLRDFVNTGGRIIIGGDMYSNDVDFLNSVFDYSITNRNNEAPSYITDIASGTSFDSAPSTLTHNNGTYSIDKSSLPINGLSIYENGNHTTVAVLPYGTGDIVYLAYDWYDAAPVGSQDGGWIEILSTITEAVPLMANSVVGTVNADDLVGSIGNDIINGLEGDDTLDAGAGNDILDGGTGGDTMDGGEGNDTYLVDSINDEITEAVDSGTDNVQSTVNYTLTSNIENLDLIGTTSIDGIGNDLDNVLTGNIGDNSLIGSAGNDIIDGGLGVDTMDGGVDNDNYTIDNVGDVVIETSNIVNEIDTVNSSVSYTLGDNLENLNLIGTTAINGIGNDLNNSLIGSYGDDIIDGWTGDDTMDGGAGNDTYLVDSINDEVTEAVDSGTDNVQSTVNYTLTSNIENITLIGTTSIDGIGNDLDNVLTGNIGDNRLIGSAGNDIIDGGLGADTMDGGADNDTYLVDSINDEVTEAVDSGTDNVQSTVNYTLTSNIENLDLIGATSIDGIGNDLDNVLTGNIGDNSLIGSAGNDIIDGGLGADTMDGGAGNDTYLVDSINDEVTEAIDSGTDNVQSTVNYTLISNIENLDLIGTTSIDGIGNDLDNILTGNIGDNSLIGNAGNDIIDGWTGDDTMDGGAGNDNYTIDNVGDVVIETSNIVNEIDTVNSSVSYTLGDNLENLNLIGTTAINGIGNILDNTLTGNAHANRLNGEDGNDSLSGDLGKDHLWGLFGNDVINGGEQGDLLGGIIGDNELDGGLGNDILLSGKGINLLTGGGGMDKFQFNGASNSTITDFSVADDTVVLKNGAFTQLNIIGILNTDNFKVGVQADDTNDYVIYNPTTGAVSYDADGSGAGTGIQIAVIGANLALTNADFVVI